MNRWRHLQPQHTKHIYTERKPSKPAYLFLGAVFLAAVFFFFGADLLIDFWALLPSLPPWERGPRQRSWQVGGGPWERNGSFRSKPWAWARTASSGVHHKYNAGNIFGVSAGVNLTPISTKNLMEMRPYILHIFESIQHRQSYIGLVFSSRSID